MPRKKVYVSKDEARRCVGDHLLDKLCWTHKATREALLKRIPELDAEIAQHERNMREGEARLPIEKQLRWKLRRFIEASIPELAGKIRVEIGSSEESKLILPCSRSTTLS